MMGGVKDRSLVEEHILATLPATFEEVARASPSYEDWYRLIDAGLQRLRKRGVISFERIKGRGAVWSRVAHD